MGCDKLTRREDRRGARALPVATAQLSFSSLFGTKEDVEESKTQLVEEHSIGEKQKRVL